MEEKILTPGTRLRLTITGIAGGGDGVGRHNGLAVFVPGTCPGEEVWVEITRVKSGCAYGTVADIITPSPKRRCDFCASEGKCGGCDFAHMSYSLQLEAKQQIVKDAFCHIGGFSQIEVEDTLPAPKEDRYRNKMVFPLGRDKKGHIVGGFYAPTSHTIVPLSDCRQGPVCASLWLNAITDFLQKNNISVYNEETGKGVARRVFIRLAEHTKEAMVVLSVNARKTDWAKDLIKPLLSVPSEYEIKSILLNIHTEKNNLLLGKENRLLYGREYIEDILGGFKFQISPHSFYQINPLQTEKLYETALSLGDVKPGETLLDLYCGIGTISLFASRTGGRIIGVEVVPQAILNAKENMERNGVSNVEFLLGKAEEIAPKLTHEKPDTVILDPPRKGAEETALSAICLMEPQKIVYISCNPATLARDAKYLCSKGYEIKRVIPVDMFPNTSHVESVALFVRTDSSI